MVKDAMTPASIHALLPPWRVIAMIVLWSGVLALLVYVRTRSSAATTVTWSLALLVLVVRAWNHRRAAKKRGVPDSEIWKHGSTRVVEVPLETEAAMQRVRRALATLPNASVKASTNTMGITVDVGRRFGVAASRLQVSVTGDGGKSRVRISSKSHFAPGFDYGTNWEYVDMFENALLSDGPKASARPT